MFYRLGHSSLIRHLTHLIVNELRVSLRLTGLRQGWTIACVRLLAVSQKSLRSATLTVAVTHPGTNAHNCCLTTISDLTTIFPLASWGVVIKVLGY